MDDHLWPRQGHGIRDLIGIERVRDHRHSAQLVEHRLLRLATRHAMNLMTRGNQTRHQLLSDRPRRTCDKHSHHKLLRRGLPYTPQDKTAAPTVTPAPSPARERGRAGGWSGNKRSRKLKRLEGVKRGPERINPGPLL